MPASGGGTHMASAWGAPLRDRLRRVAGTGAVPLLLCAVAAVQVTRVACCDQSPWLGGGFGMFATPDSRQARFVKVYLLTADREVPAEAPWLLETAIARTAPTADNLDRVAAELCKRQWVADPER